MQPIINDRTTGSVNTKSAHKVCDFIEKHQINEIKVQQPKIKNQGTTVYNSQWSLDNQPSLS